MCCPTPKTPKKTLEIVYLCYPSFLIRQGNNWSTLLLDCQFACLKTGCAKPEDIVPKRLKSHKSEYEVNSQSEDIESIAIVVVDGGLESWMADWAVRPTQTS